MRARPATLAALVLLLISGWCMALLAPASAAGNAFRVTCSSSHVANDDPIVLPGRPGAAHRHEFFGATSTNAHSTSTQLEAGGTSCALRADTAAYWAPTLEVRGIQLRGSMTAYYQRNGKPRAAAPPHRLRMIAGDMRASSPQPLGVTNWQCVGGGRSLRSRQIPRCERGEQLGAWILFPDCWDGRRIDSADHKMHVARSRRGRCPDTHPVAIMRLAVLITWPVRPADPETVRLAGGMLAAAGMHADFWNTWRQSTLRQLRWDCIEVARPCGALVTRGRPAARSTARPAS